MYDRSDRRITRRGVLAAGAGAAAAAVAGCGRAANGAAGATGSASPAATSAAVPAAAATSSAPVTKAAAAAWAVPVAAGERTLLASYDAVAKAHPALKTKLAPLRAAHAAHLKALKVTGSGKAISGLPTAQAQALSRLAAAEQKAADSTAAACVTCPTEAAALLGSIAAADASHVLVLQSIGAT
jgi:hypothetical protein